MQNLFLCDSYYIYLFYEKFSVSNRHIFILYLLNDRLLVCLELNIIFSYKMYKILEHSTSHLGSMQRIPPDLCRYPSHAYEWEISIFLIILFESLAKIFGYSLSIQLKRLHILKPQVFHITIMHCIMLFRICYSMEMNY